MSKVKRYSQPVFPKEDKLGFDMPSTPGHSLKLLNGYMRTDLLRSIHEKFKARIDSDAQGTPLSHLAKSLGDVIETYDRVNLFECVERNPFHLDPDYEFNVKKDYRHDIKLMKHHYKSHLKTLSELDD